jgi:hypothetical protein
MYTPADPQDEELLGVTATRKSGRKPLESLKTDSEIAAGGRLLAPVQAPVIARGRSERAAASRSRGQWAAWRFRAARNYFVLACRGTVATKQEPWFTRLVMVSLPRCRVRMCLTMARPRPVPFLARLWVASTR